MIDQQDEVIDIDLDFQPPKSQLMRRAKAHFDKHGMTWKEKSGIFYFRPVRFCLSTKRVWIQGGRAFTRRGFRFLHSVLTAEGRGRRRPGNGTSTLPS